MILKRANQAHEKVIDLAFDLAQHFIGHSGLAWARVDVRQDATVVVAQGPALLPLKSAVADWGVLGADAIVSPVCAHPPTVTVVREEPRLVYPGHVLLRAYPDGDRGGWAAFLEHRENGRIAFGKGVVAALRALADRIEQEGMPGPAAHLNGEATS